LKPSGPGALSIGICSINVLLGERGSQVLQVCCREAEILKIKTDCRAFCVPHPFFEGVPERSCISYMGGNFSVILILQDRDGVSLESFSGSCM
jgi:hypothetical protein